MIVPENKQNRILGNNNLMIVPQNQAESDFG